MAGKSTPRSEIEFVELQVFLNSRGRSVVNGTLLVNGEMRTIKHDLAHLAREQIGKVILSVLAPSFD
jgi:hypothetical protein